MAILKRYICSKHGEFEGWEGDGIRCPAAKCRCKPREMMSAPALHITGTRQKADATLNGLAKDFNMTNIKSTKEGDNQSGHFTHAQNREPKPGDSVLWGNGGRFSMDHILKNGAAQSVRGESVGIKLSEAGVKQGPRTASYIADHENLKIKP